MAGHGLVVISFRSLLGEKLEASSNLWLRLTTSESLGTFFPGPTTRVCDSVDLGQNPGICMFLEFPGDSVHQLGLETTFSDIFQRHPLSEVRIRGKAHNNQGSRYDLCLQVSAGHLEDSQGKEINPT